MKRALVISGGGSKGAFAVGVIKRLLSTFPTLDFDIYVGTSTGSLIMPLALLQEYELLEEIYTTQKTENIVTKFNLGDRLDEHSIFDVNPLWRLIEKNLTIEKYESINASEKELFIATTCLQTSGLTVFTTAKNPAEAKRYQIKKIKDHLHLKKAILASACQPVFMPPVKVNKDVPDAEDAGFQYVDGGVLEYTGIEMAIDNGATEIFTISLSAANHEPVNKEFKDIFSILQQTIEIFSDDVSNNDLIIPQQYNEALIYIDAVKNKMKMAGLTSEEVTEFFRVRGRENPYENKVPLKLFLIRPDQPLDGGPGGFIFDPEKMKNMVRIGTSATDDFVANLNPGDISWV